MRLHESPSPNARRVHVFLAEKGIDALPTVRVDIRGGENLTDEYRKLNPFGRVPVLELDDGTCLSESVAICRYFEGLNPEPSLFGREPLEMAIIEMWNRRAEINFMLQATGAFRNLTGFFKDREKVSKEWGAIALGNAADALARFDTALSGSRFLAGEKFSIADITFAVALQFAQMVKLDLPFDLPNIARYLDEVGSRQSFQDG
ncbi:MAG: glutathione S-transferase [Pseudomonadales bacterium]|nr:glutathione S-transferase family protein [Pseudomonadales bacterium]NIX09190.1 glutathione S-transferase [Pseudomonadales bacterium]